ncbi:Ppx/GppA phosphatase family protein [Aliarcobacter butzleri RM4018]|uniref:Ppx/GppA phosphatase family protein n=1 Tax=Aliarcobacter butzleri (strain RM4018) TaxID=367737 RepID=A8ETZ0_ALIB4|nr:exopolyphosphatase [Aliarcobacter butzleri]ABV67414.1 Ppx/GppA phosphatase family protein [Aliarcobacter butzleri RM4018]MCG3662141.1 exopolyphosphatase [Aliarcobacter butzleri]GGT73246.1 bifunctional 3-dehydroquinate synthase/phosphatase [Aliarcobacter butzleri]SNV28532.1 Exopolyphosphatase [Aliarcobacter butzleri]
MKFNEIVTIDLGSNSFRVLKYDYKNHKIISEFNEVVGMADGLVETLNISKDAMIRVINAINKASQDLNFDPKDAVCVTTAAMRKALNNKEVLSFFEEKTGAKFSIIDANEEARLTLLAVKYALKREKINSENFVLLDIGGGSTEIVVNTAQNYEAKSFDFGIVTMTQKSIKKEDLEKDLNDRKIQIKEFLNSLKIDLKDYSFVATAGTPTTIAAIKLGQDYFSYDRNIVNGTKVNLNDLEDSLKIFKSHSKDELTKLVGQGRVEFMEVGTYIYKMVFEVLQKHESIVLDDGLREGVAINYALNKVN